MPDGAARGGHAHRAQEQFLIMLAGSCTVTIDDGEGRSAEPQRSPFEGLYLPAGLWLELSDMTAGVICVFLASGAYDEHDYIRDDGEVLAWR